MRSITALELPAAIQKKQIAEYHAQAGTINEKPFRGFAAGSLRYRMFAGALNLETNLYTGVHVFDQHSGEGDRADFTKLFGGK